MKQVNNRKDKPSQEEVQGAIEMQAPLDKKIDALTVKGEEKISSVSAFKQLAKFSRNAALVFGGNVQWIQPAMLMNESYRDGYESPPFFITRAWSFDSKKGYGTRLGLEIVFDNQRMYNIAFGLHPKDIKRNQILGMYWDLENKKAIHGVEPIGPFCITKLPTQKGNDYYDLAVFVPETTTEINIPFIEIDPDIPF